MAAVARPLPRSSARYSNASRTSGGAILLPAWGLRTSPRGASTALVATVAMAVTITAATAREVTWPRQGNVRMSRWRQRKDVRGCRCRYDAGSRVCTRLLSRHGVAHSTVGGTFGSALRMRARPCSHCIGAPYRAQSGGLPAELRMRWTSVALHHGAVSCSGRGPFGDALGM